MAQAQTSDSMATDYIDTLPDRVAAMRKKVDELVRYYGGLKDLDLPEQIISVGNEINKETELLVPLIDTETLKKWNKRMIKIESVNAVLRNIEESAVYDLTVSSSTIFAKEIHKTLRVIEWLLGHADQITGVSKLAFEKAEKKYGEQILWGVLGFFINLAIGDLDGIDKSIDGIGNGLDSASTFIAECVMGSIAISAVESLLAGFSIESFRRKIEPILTLKSNAEADVMRMAFPVGKPGRARRKKAHRVRL